MKVLFLINRKEPQADVFAVFPESPYNNDSNLVDCYSAIGQHSSCHKDYIKESEQATEELYSDLKKELVYCGYDNLEILNN